jgi:hypothetical protein
MVGRLGVILAYTLKSLSLKSFGTEWHTAAFNLWNYRRVRRSQGLWQ